MLTGAPPTPGSVALTEGRLAEARALFWDEADRARSRGDGYGLAEAALGLGGLWVHENRSTLEGHASSRCNARHWPGSTKRVN